MDSEDGHGLMQNNCVLQCIREGRQKFVKEEEDVCQTFAYWGTNLTIYSRLK